MTHPRFNYLSVLALALFMAACAGTNELHINSQPSGAKLYVNDKYVGLTPQVVTAAYGDFGQSAETLKLSLAKVGYQTRNETITLADLQKAASAGNYKWLASSHGVGSTFEFNYALEPVGSTVPPPAPTIHGPPTGHTIPAPKNQEPWR